MKNINTNNVSQSINTQNQNNKIDNTKESILSKVNSIINWDKSINKIDDQETKHLTLELELAKMFWVENTKTIEDDHKQPMTVADVLAWAEELWEEEHLIAA